MLDRFKSEVRVALMDTKFWGACGLLVVIGLLTTGAFSLISGGKLTGASVTAWVLYSHLIFTLDFAVAWLSIRRFARSNSGQDTAGTVLSFVYRILITMAGAEVLLVALIFGSYVGGWIFLPGGEGGDLPFGFRTETLQELYAYLFQYFSIAALTVVAVSGVVAGIAAITGSFPLSVMISAVLWLVSGLSVYAPWRLGSLLYFQFYGIPRWLAGETDFPVLLLFVVPVSYAIIGWFIVLWSRPVHE